MEAARDSRLIGGLSIVNSLSNSFGCRRGKIHGPMSPSTKSDKQSQLSGWAGIIGAQTRRCLFCRCCGHTCRDLASVDAENILLHAVVVVVGARLLFIYINNQPSALNFPFSCSIADADKKKMYFYLYPMYSALI
eukprot:Filipodium_phascolosomae@DN2577_c0_g1_i3.p1